VIVSSVLRKSDTFDERVVYWQGRQIAKHYPGVEYLPFSDVPLNIPYIPLESDLPKWWAKMHIAQYGFKEPVLVVDLATVVVKPLDIPQDRPLVLRHFTRPASLACGLMLWTPAFQDKLAAHFFRNSRRHMVDANWDDQRYFRRYFGNEMGRFQDSEPDGYPSYKATVAHWGLRPENGFVFFHGMPKPWHLELPWIPPLESC
jgi:hypothetical protein